MASAHSYAQTNIQLYNQLQAAGYQEADLALVRDAYRLSTELFGGHFRPTGKVFVAHLVGTASILAHLGSPPRTVAAGLLHSAHTHGTFRDPRWGPTATKRRKVRAAVGDEVEAIVARYAVFAWGREAVVSLADRLDDLTAEDREVLLIRLANELEDHLDSGMLYSRKDKAKKLGRSGTVAAVRLAKEVGGADFGTELEMAYARSRNGGVPAVFQAVETVSYATHASPHTRVYRSLSRIARRVLRSLRKASRI